MSIVPSPKRLQLAAVLAVALISCATACVYLYGDAPDSLSPPVANHYDFNTWGNDWDHDPTWSCLSGKEQSPINFESGKKTGMPAPKKLRTRFHYPPIIANGSDINVINNGHAIQVNTVNALYTTWMPSVIVPYANQADSTVLDVLNKQPSELTSSFQANPVQFHFHTGSEHMLMGWKAPLELHIVHYVPNSTIPNCNLPGIGCIVVVGVLFYIEEGYDNPALDKIFDLASEREGEKVNVPAGDVIDLAHLVPQGGKGQYMQYAGSLTTPPCFEGLLWHVFAEKLPMSLRQWERFMELTSFKECEQTDANATMAGNRRHLHSHSHDHHHAPKRETFRTTDFVRTTFKTANNEPITGRSLLDASTSNWTCTMGSYGYNARIAQPVNGRVIKNYAP